MVSRRLEAPGAQTQVHQKAEAFACRTETEVEVASASSASIDSHCCLNRTEGRDDRRMLIAMSGFGLVMWVLIGALAYLLLRMLMILSSCRVLLVQEAYTMQ